MRKTEHAETKVKKNVVDNKQDKVHTRCHATN